MTRVGDWNTTYTGLAYWPLDPRAEEVCIEDIAHALSLQCRFGGHCRTFYSVADHCLRVSTLLVDHDPIVQLWGLLHDAPEAYLMDIPRPLKYSPVFEAYRALEHKNMAVICERFGLPPVQPPEVKAADWTMLATEARDLMPARSVEKWKLEASPLPGIVYPMSPEQSEAAFLTLFHRLKERV